MKESKSISEYDKPLQQMLWNLTAKFPCSWR